MSLTGLFGARNSNSSNKDSFIFDITHATATAQNGGNVLQEDELLWKTNSGYWDEYGGEKGFLWNEDSAWSSDNACGHQSPAPYELDGMQQFEAVFASLQALDGSHGGRSRSRSCCTTPEKAESKTTEKERETEVGNLLLSSQSTSTVTAALRQYPSSSNSPPPTTHPRKSKAGGGVGVELCNIASSSSTTEATSSVIGLATGTSSSSSTEDASSLSASGPATSSFHGSSSASAVVIGGGGGGSSYAPAFFSAQHREASQGDTLLAVPVVSNLDKTLSSADTGTSQSSSVLAGMESGCRSSSEASVDPSLQNYHQHQGDHSRQASLSSSTAAAAAAALQNGMTATSSIPGVSHPSPAPRLSLDLSSLSPAPASSSWQDQQDQQRRQWQTVEGSSSNGTQNIQYHNQNYSQNNSAAAPPPPPPPPQQQQQQIQSTLSPYLQLQQSLQAFQQQYGVTATPSSLPSSFPESNPLYTSGLDSSYTQYGSNNVGKYGESVRRPVTSMSSNASPASSSSSASSSRPPSVVSNTSFGFNSPAGSSSAQTGYSSTSNAVHSDWLSPTSDSSFSHQQQQQQPSQQQYQQPQNFQSFPQQPYSQQSQHHDQLRHQQNGHGHLQSDAQNPSSMYGRQNAPGVSPLHIEPYWSSTLQLNADVGVAPTTPTGGFGVQGQLANGSNHSTDSNAILSSYPPSTYHEPPSPQLASPSTAGPYPFSTVDPHYASNLGVPYLPSAAGDTWPNQNGFQTSAGDHLNTASHFPVYNSAQNSASYDFSIQDLPLHFDYSIPGAPQPLPGAASSSSSAPTFPLKNKRSLQKQLAAPGPEKAWNSVRRTSTTSNISNFSQDSTYSSEQHMTDQPAAASPSGSSESSGSNYFSKGSKRCRPGRKATNEKEVKKSSSALFDTVSSASSQSGSDSHGQGHASLQSAKQEASHQSRLSNGAPNEQLQRNREGLPQFASLRLDTSVAVPQLLHQNHFADGAQGSNGQSSTGKENAVPSSPAETDVVDGMDLQDENEADGSKARATSGSRRQYECKICSRTFPRPSALTVHERIHSGEKPFVCKFCNRPFTVASNLRRHQKIHSKEQDALPADKTAEESQSSNDSTIKGAPANKLRRTSLKNGLQESGTKSMMPAIGSVNGSTSPAGDITSASGEDNESAPYSNGFRKGSPQFDHFDLPPLHARDFAHHNMQTMPALAGLTAEQQAMEKQELEKIRQWSNSIDQ